MCMHPFLYVWYVMFSDCAIIACFIDIDFWLFLYHVI